MPSSLSRDSTLSAAEITSLPTSTAQPGTLSSEPRILLFAISGPSCSGKTTLARLIRNALTPHAFIIHEDDFYKTDSAIPVVVTREGQTLQDWDCFESLDYQRFESVLHHVRHTGRLQEGFESMEDKNDVGHVELNHELLEAWRKDFQKLVTDHDRIVIVDGFLLFSKEMEQLRPLYDVKILLRVDYATLKARREARKGYVTLEGFWQDPPGYVDHIVWPNYVKDHQFLFEESDVEGSPNGDLCRRLQIEPSPLGSVNDMTDCFVWAASLLKSRLEKQL